MHHIFETFLLSHISFLSYPVNNFLKEGKQTSTLGRDKSIHEQANTVNSLKATTSHKRPLCKYPFYFKNSLVRDHYLNFLNDRDHSLG